MKKNAKKTTAIALAITLVISTFSFTNTKVSANEINSQVRSNVMETIYVGSTGNDTSGDGSQFSPFATLQRAQQAVQQINQNMTGDIIVSIAQGDYYMPDTLHFTPQDSGTNGYNVIWESSDGIGAAKLIGGVPVDPSDWELAAQSDVNNYGMPTDLVGKVWKTQLDKANYPTTFSGLNSEAFNTLYVDDTRATMARTPNLITQAGFPQAKDTYKRTAGSSNGKNIQIYKGDLTADQINGLQLAQNNGKEVAQVFTWDGGTGGVAGSWDWFTDTEPVASIDIGSSTISLNQPQVTSSDFYDKYQYYVKYPVSNGSRYFLQGNLSFLDTPGEYYYDKTEGMLYYYPADGTMTNKTVVTPTMQTIINMQGTPKAKAGDKPNPALQVHHIVLDGLAVKDTEFSDYYSYTYNYGDMGGFGVFPPVALEEGVTMPAYVESAERPAFQVGSITMQGTNNITIKNSLVKNAGVYGIFMKGDNQYDTITNTTVEYTGAGGISMDGGYPGVGKYSNHNTINNVLIHDVGQLVGHGVGLTVMNTGQSTFSHLEIYNSPKRGMLILGGYPRGGKGANPDFDNVRDNYTVGNHFSYIYLHHTHQDAGEDSSLFMSWLTAGGGQWYSAATQHGSADVNHLTTNLSEIDLSVDRYNYMDQVLIGNIGTAASVHEKNSVGGLDTAMGATGFVFSNVQAVNVQSHSLAIRPGNSGGYGDMYIFQNVTNNIDDISSVQSFDSSKMQYNLIGLTSSFPTQLLGANQPTYPQTTPSNVYFSDTFNESALDTTKWTVEKGSVDMSMGVLASPNDPLLGNRSLSIFTPLNRSGVVVSRPFAEPINKIVTVKFFDRHKDHFFGDPPTTSPNDPNLAHTYLRVDDGKNILGVGANGNVSYDYYTIQKGDQSIVTNVRRDFGWRTLTMDYSSGTEVKISIDDQQVTAYTEEDDVATAFTYVGMGDWGTSWPDGKSVGSSTNFSDFYIYGGQEAPPVLPLANIPPTAEPTQIYSEDFSNYAIGSTDRPIGWKDSREGTSNAKASFRIVEDATVGKAMRITEPDNVVFYGLGDSSLKNYTLTMQAKFVSWSGNTNGTYASFGPSVFVSGNDRGNVSRYELRYNYPNLSNGQWSIYQRGGNPTDNNLISNIKMPDGYNMNDWNTYKIETGNGSITYYVNDTVVAQVSNPSNAFGGFGFGGYNATFDVADISLVQNQDSFKLLAKSVTPTNSVSDGTNGPTGTATVTFTADRAGTYYYSVVYSAANQPIINTSGTGVEVREGDNTINIPNLAPYVPYTVYIQEKDAKGKLSNILKMDIPSSTPKLNYLTSGNGTVTKGNAGTYLSGTAMLIDATPDTGSYFLNWTASNGGVFADANSASTEFATSFYDNTVTANFYHVSNFNSTTTGTVYNGTDVDLVVDVEGTNLNNPGAAVGMYVLANGMSYPVKAGTQTINVSTPLSGDLMTVQLYDQKGNLLGTTDVSLSPPIETTLVGITTPTAITGVANGTAKRVEALGLPSTVLLETDAESVNAKVTWDVEASSYDPLLTTEQTFTVNGTVTLPAGVLNPDEIALTTSISVTVNATTESLKVVLSGQGNVDAGDSFTLTYVLSNVVEFVYALDQTIHYDKTQVEFLSVEAMQSGFSIVGQKEGEGEVRILMASAGPGSAIKQTAPVLKLNFKAKEIDQNATSSIFLADVTAAGANGIETAVSNGSAHTIQIIVVDKAALQALITSAQATHDAAIEGAGIGQYPAGSKAILQAVIDRAKAVASQGGATQEQLNQAMDQLQAALQAFTASVNVAANGDLNGDGKFSIGDLALIAVSYGKTSADADWAMYKQADMNGDGKIDIVDLAAVAKLIMG
jgi:hypothetical protein